MVGKMNGLSRDLIIHPGETLNDILLDRNIQKKGLAISTGMSEKHISEVMQGNRGISASLAKKLEYALAINSSFWINLQANYDNELALYNEQHNIRGVS